MTTRRRVTERDTHNQWLASLEKVTDRDEQNAISKAQRNGDANAPKFTGNWTDMGMYVDRVELRVWRINRERAK